MPKKPSLAPDPRLSFGYGNSSEERLAKAFKLVTNKVTETLALLYSGNENSISKILKNPDTVDTLTKELVRTNACCSFPVFLRQIGARNPENFMRDMVETSATWVADAFDIYKREKTALSLHRVESFVEKHDFVPDMTKFVCQLDKSAIPKEYEISKKATLLPPIRPPVSRPGKTETQSPTKLVPITETEGKSSKLTKELVSSKLQSTQLTRSQKLKSTTEPPLSEVVPTQGKSVNSKKESSSPVLVDISHLLPKEKTAVPKLVGAKSKAIPSFRMARTLLSQAIAKDLIRSLPDNEGVFFIAPVDERIIDLQKKIPNFNDPAMQTLVIKSHILTKSTLSGGDMYLQNLHGEKYTYSPDMKSITHEKTGTTFDLMDPKQREKFENLSDVKIRYYVTEQILPAPQN